jgi:alpha-1,3-mannosyltransferase
MSLLDSPTDRRSLTVNAGLAHRPRVASRERAAPVHVVHVTSAFDPVTGGIERFIHDLCTAGRAAGAFESSVVQIGTRALAPRRYRLDGIEVHAVPCGGVPPFYRLPDLGEAIAPASVVHLHDPQVAGIAWSLTGRQRLRPVVLSTHGGFFHTGRFATLKKLHYRFLVPRLLARMEMVVASSASDEARFRPVAPRLVRIENAIDFERFHAARRAERGGGLRLLCVGRLATNKRVDRLIRCVGALVRRGRDASLDVAGAEFDGLRANLEERARLAGVAERVRFHGAVDDARLLELLADADAYVSASEYEGFGLGAVEAMAAGVLPLLNRIPPFERLLTGPLARLLVDYDDAEAAADRVLQVLGAPAAERARLSEAVIARAREYAWSERVHDFAAVYAQAIRQFETSSPNA